MPILAAIGYTMIFGFSFMFSRRALFVIEPLHLLAFRFLAAALFMNILRGLKAIRIDYRELQLAPLLLLAVLQPILYFLFETTGISLTSASEAGLMVATIPIFTVILAFIFLKEKPPFAQLFSIVLSVAGVMLIGFMQARGTFDANFVGLVLLLGAAISGAAYSVLSRHLSRRYTAVEMTYAMMNIGALFFTALSLAEHFWEGQFQNFLAPLSNPSVVSGVLYLGILSSGVAFFLLNYALSQLTAAQVSAFPSLTTLIAVASGVLLLGESLYWYHIAGGGAIIIGVWGTNYFARRTRRLSLSSR